MGGVGGLPGTCVGRNLGAGPPLSKRCQSPVKALSIDSGGEVHPGEPERLDIEQDGQVEGLDHPDHPAEVPAAVLGPGEEDDGWAAVGHAGVVEGLPDGLRPPPRPVHLDGVVGREQVHPGAVGQG